MKKIESISALPFRSAITQYRMDVQIGPEKQNHKIVIHRRRQITNFNQMSMKTVFFLVFAINFISTTSFGQKALPYVVDPTISKTVEDNIKSTYIPAQSGMKLVEKATFGYKIILTHDSCTVKYF